MTEKRKQIGLGTMGPEEQHSDKFLEFSFCLIYPRLGDGESDIMEMSAGAHQKAPTESMLSVAKRQEKAQPKKKENF